MKNNQPEKSKYLAALKAAIDWALNDNRIAWKRTIEKINKSNERYSINKLEEVKEQLLLHIDSYLENWFSPIYDHANDTSALFDSEAPPEEIWRLMISFNTGIFTQTFHNPLLNFITNIPSNISDTEPLYLYLNIDGWGVKKY